MEINTAEAVAIVKKYLAFVKKAYEAGDAETAISLHSENKSFFSAGEAVLIEKNEFKAFARAWFASTNLTFSENIIERVIVYGDLLQCTYIFELTQTPKTGGEPIVIRKRSQITLNKSDENETGWVLLNEITQEAPAK